MGKFNLAEVLKDAEDRAMAELENVSDSDTSDMLWIETEKIKDNPLNFYPQPVGHEFDDLLESIKANGLLEPPTVVADGEEFRLISGHSRMKAVRMILYLNQDDEKWKKVLCRVLPEMTEDQERSAVIEANRQRKKTPALIQQEAEALTEAYIARKKAGEDLPGRIRDRVAEAMQISATRLANLKVIKEGLKVPGFIAKWESGDLPESVALKIAQMDHERQYRLLDWTIDKHKELSLKNVRTFDVIYTSLKHECPANGKFCENAEVMHDAFFRGGEWHCPGCCRSCLRNQDCIYACMFIEKAHAPEPVPQVPKNPALQDPRLEIETMSKAFRERLADLRVNTGLSRKEFAESIGRYQATYSAWENGELPGTSNMPLLALALGVTTDYLYGLTCEPTPQKSVSAWQPLDEAHWPGEGRLLMISANDGLGGRTYAAVRCIGQSWDTFPFEDMDGISVGKKGEFEEYEYDHWMAIEEV